MTTDNQNNPKVQLDPTTFRGSAGYYRVGQCQKGRWWLVTPDNQPMLYKGCNAVLRQAPGHAGENMYFRWAAEKYGNDLTTFVKDAARILQSTGFNGWGGWSTTAAKSMRLTNHYCRKFTNACLALQLALSHRLQTHNLAQFRRQYTTTRQLAKTN